MLVLTLALTRQHPHPPAAVVAMPNDNPALGSVLRAALGEVASLHDARFSPASGSAGMWRPSDFLSENTLGIYFTEPYDPKRIPVLFVHGIGGSPQDFRFLMAHFDRARYQLWFFHYPSGLRLHRLGEAMAKGLEILQQRHGFQECHIIAHSMGGLVSAGGIRELNRTGEANFITKFITISTPFGGHEAAELGIRHLSKPVPSWIDVAPGSAFLAGLKTAPLPHNTRYDLICGGTDGNDGVVTVASQLESHNRAKAASATRFAFGHEQILNEPAVLARVLECLQPGKTETPQTTLAMRN
jgi:pimeloyl-ACP methyl ester carboxylesterase